MNNQDISNVNANFVLSGLDSEVEDRIVASRRSAFARYGKLALLGSAPLVVAMASTEAFAAGGLPQQVVDVLNFALTLEYLEAAFYKKGNATRGLIPAKYRGLFRTIGAHETAHVALLKGALGAAAVAAPNVDFTSRSRISALRHTRAKPAILLVHRCCRRRCRSTPSKPATPRPFVR
jgi:hypothetical protein